MKSNMYEEFIEDHFDEDVAHCITLMKNGTYTLEEMLVEIKKITNTVDEYQGFPLTMGLHFELIYRDGNLGYAVSQGACRDYYIEVPDKYHRLPVICVSSYGFTCDDIEEIELPGTVIYVEDFAFQAKKLRSITVTYNLKPNHWGVERVPCSLRQIGARAFSACSNLSQINCYTSYDTWQKIYKDKEWAYNMPSFMLNCQDKSVKFPANIDCIDQEGTYSKGLEYEIKAGQAWIVGMGNCKDENLTIPKETYDGYRIIGIEEKAFCNRKNLSSVVIPKTVEIIKGAAFAQCSNLKSVKLHYGLKEIRGFVFEDCCSLTSIEIPSSVVNIGNNPELADLSVEEILLRKIFGESKCARGVSSGNPFKGCSKLRSIKVNSSNPNYHDHINCLIDTHNKTLIAGCKNSIFPGDESIDTIGAYAFYGCAGFENGLFIFEEPKFKRIEEYAFAQCGAIKTLSFPKSVTYIGDHAFENCKSLSEIKFPDALTKICSNAFSGCGKLYSVDFPPNISEIGFGAFRDCINLTKVHFSENSAIVSLNGDTFSKCSSLMEIELPSNLQEIGRDVFEECRNLQNINLPNYLKKIESCAFNSCKNLQKVFIPKSVQNIAAYAFLNCYPALTTIECESSIKPEGWDPNWNMIYQDAYYSVMWGATLVAK